MAPEEIVNKVIGMSRNMSRPIYRGQANSDWPLESGAVRRLVKALGEEFPTDENKVRDLVHEYHRKRLIGPMKIIDGLKVEDFQRLSDLQHLGAATGFLDFTENPLVAIWFACNEHPCADAKIFAMDIGDPDIAENGRWMQSSQDDPFNSTRKVVYYEPDHSLGSTCYHPTKCVCGLRSKNT